MTHSRFILSMGWNSSHFANISVCRNIHGVKAFPHKIDIKIYLHFHVEQNKYHQSLTDLLFFNISSLRTELNTVRSVGEAAEKLEVVLGV